MKLTLSRPAEREIDFAIGEIVAGREHQALRRLCHIRGLPVPAMKERRRRSRIETLPDGSMKVSGKTPVVIPAPPVGVALQPASSATVPGARMVSHPSIDGGRPFLAAPVPERQIRPQPKPAKRIVDRDNLTSFAERFPDCAILGCRSYGEIDTHHLRKRSAGGSDADENLLRLHRAEHEEYHRIGGEAFRAKYASRLKPTDLLKIRLAVEMEANAKLAGREVVDLDAEGM